MKREFTPEGVGALIVCQDSPALFLGVKHAKAKEVSQKLAGQISMPTETSLLGESDAETLDRLWQEELAIDNLMNPGIILNHCVLETNRTKAILRNYLFFAPLRSDVKLIDGEIADVGWFKIQDVLESPKGSCRFRPGLLESILGYLRWQKNPDHFNPEYIKQPQHFIPAEVFVLMKEGISEKEALSRLGLYTAPVLRIPTHFHL